ncbi:MAG: hypothetical protein K1000chlam1_01138 [Candidatus Anoxychlamydiales bacterium]|nr:hypothetical protein [Candidatus Anoxychlamydiales bacterium]
MGMFSPESPDNEESRDMATDHQIDNITADPESLAFGLFSMLVTYEDHYNNIQNKYKGLSITWVIATFVSIGYLLSGYEKALNIDSLLIILFLTILASQGIFLIWFIDAGVYHKLISSIWLEIYKIEENHPEIGKSHHLVLELHKKDSDPEKFHGIFYATSIFFLLFVGLGSLSLYLYLIKKWLILITIFIFIVVIIAAHFLVRTPLFRTKDEN